MRYRWSGLVACIAATASAQPSALVMTCDPETMSDAALERCQARLDAAQRALDARVEQSARRAFLAARAQCATRGDKIVEMVARVFDAEDFGSRVIRNWRELSAEQVRDFAVLADRVVGVELRAQAVRDLCVPNARLVSVVNHGDDVYLKVHQPEIDECTTLVFFPDGGDRWRYGGVEFCGVDAVWSSLRDRFGGEYAAAMRHLRDAVVAPTSCVP